MNEEEPSFRASNLMKGALLGAFAAAGAFFAVYALSERRPPIGFDVVTLRAYLNSIASEKPSGRVSRIR